MVSPVVVQAIVNSSIIALLSCGLSLTYMTTKVPNFAQGTLATIGVYSSFTFVKIWKANPYAYSPLGFILGGLAGLGLYYLVVRPLIRRSARLVTLMISTVGYDLVLSSLINIYADYLSNTYKVLTRLFSIDYADFRFSSQLIGTNLPGMLLVAPATVAVVTITLHWVLTRTRFGVAMRATVENPALASVVGVNIDLVYAVSWLVSGGLAGVAGVYAGIYLVGNPDLGNVLLPTIFAASIVGGLTNIYGALLGGFITEVTEILGTSYVASLVVFNTSLVAVLEYQFLVPLVFIVATLLIAPSGITGVDWASFGRRTRQFLLSVGEHMHGMIWRRQ